MSKKVYNVFWDYDLDTGNFYSGILKLTPQDLADMISFVQAEKVKKDNEIKKKYENKRDNS